MKLTALVENIPHTPDFEARHGLSFYIEVGDRKILFDLGPDDAFLHNAHKLGVDLAAVDTVVLSHGHYDHGGGIRLFLQCNSKAKIYLSQHAFGDYYAKTEDREQYVGLDQTLPRDSLVFTGGDTDLGDGLLLFCGVAGDKYQSASSAIMVRREGEAFIRDDFSHEQSLLILEGSNKVLLGGCAHSGIVNILEEAERRAGEITHLISGFHLMAPTETEELIHGIAGELAKRGTQYYTCHCTGERAYGLMKAQLGQQIDYFASGMTLVL